MSSLNNLSVSIKNLENETSTFIQYFSNRLTQLIFSPVILHAELDIKNYCLLLRSIKDYSYGLPSNEDSLIIKEKINNLPDLKESDFSFYTSIPIQGWILFVLLPIGIIIWLIYYIKITVITEKLNIIKANLGTINYFLNNLLYR